MFRSIRTNLFTAFLSLISLFLISVLVINVFFLDDIFIFGSQQSMERTVDGLADAVKNGTFSEETVAEASYRSGLFIGVLSETGMLEYNTGLPRAKMERPVGAERPESEYRRSEDNNVIDESNDLLRKFESEPESKRLFYTEKTEGPRRSVIMLQRLDNGKILLVTKPLMPLKESSQLATIFILASGAVVLLVGSIGVFLISGRLTAPIMNMDRVARKMANLDFSEGVVISSQDELGALGSSIQSMSENLHRTLNELKEANGRLHLEIEHERELDRQRRRFISSVSHELRTPLSMIQGYADGLRHGVVDDPEDVREYCDVIVDETKKMGGLIRDMLDLSSYEAGAFTVIPATFDLAQMIRIATQRVETLRESKNSLIEVSGPDPCLAFGDEGRIGQILSNFLNNALNHGTPGEPVKVSYGIEGEDTYIKVFNQGSPIPPDELDRIWDPFYKAGEGVVSRGAGFGLGLSIARAIAEAHEGHCAAENSENGVVFALFWPAAALE